VQVGVEFLKKTLLEYTANNPKFFVIYQVPPAPRTLQFAHKQLPQLFACGAAHR